MRSLGYFGGVMSSDSVWLRSMSVSPPADRASISALNRPLYHTLGFADAAAPFVTASESSIGADSGSSAAISASSASDVSLASASAGAASSGATASSAG